MFGFKKWQIQSDNQGSLHSLALVRFQTPQIQNLGPELGGGGWRDLQGAAVRNSQGVAEGNCLK